LFIIIRKRGKKKSLNKSKIKIKRERRM